MQFESPFDMLHNPPLKVFSISGYSKVILRNFGNFEGCLDLTQLNILTISVPLHMCLQNRVWDIFPVTKYTIKNLRGKFEFKKTFYIVFFSLYLKVLF